MSFFQTCKATRSDKENLQLDKNFCEEERLRAGVKNFITFIQLVSMLR